MNTEEEMEALHEAALEIEDVLKKHKAGLCYTTDDDGIHIYIKPSMRDSTSMGWPNYTETL
jgi:hypothetical protein